MIYCTVSESQLFCFICELNGANLQYACTHKMVRHMLRHGRALQCTRALMSRYDVVTVSLSEKYDGCRQ
jgi:hypothetical protein